MKIITVTLAPNQAVLTCYLQDQSPKMPNAAIRPAMLVVPGGGYQYCSDREGEPVALAYMAQGFNAFVLRYTADATTPIDKALQDGAAAMDYLRANAAELEIDPQQTPPLAFLPVGIWLLRWAHCSPRHSAPTPLCWAMPRRWAQCGPSLAARSPTCTRWLMMTPRPHSCLLPRGTRWFLLRTALFCRCFG